MLEFTKAKKEQIWLKIMLNGPSGAGKTYSALALAQGIVSKEGGTGIAVIDTENRRSLYYANEFEFYDVQLEAPYSPTKYMEAINAATKNGFKVIIIDSITHEWDWCNAEHDKMPGNSFTNWAKITPKHNALMELILQAPAHIIVTVRGKDTYVLEEKNGKQIPKKVGLGYSQRSNIEYNYTVAFNIDVDNHVATATKDNTHLFDGRFDVLTTNDGELLYDWANSGEKIIETVGMYINKISKEFQIKLGMGVPKETLYNIIFQNHGDKDFRTITDMEVAKKIIEEMKVL